MLTLLRSLSVVLAVALCAASAVQKKQQPASQPAASAGPASPAQPQDGPECEQMRRQLAAQPACAKIESLEKRDACEVSAIDQRRAMRQKGCQP